MQEEKLLSVICDFLFWKNGWLLLLCYLLSWKNFEFCTSKTPRKRGSREVHWFKYCLKCLIRTRYILYFKFHLAQIQRRLVIKWINIRWFRESCHFLLKCPEHENKGFAWKTLKNYTKINGNCTLMKHDVLPPRKKINK